jgi:hypothetical protein
MQAQLGISPQRLADRILEALRSARPTVAL